MRIHGRFTSAIPAIASLTFLATMAWAAPPPVPASIHNHTLAPVGVTGVAAIKGAVRALQEIKVALKRPISSDPADANLTVCKIDHQARGVYVQERMGAIIECGSTSWWLYRRDNCESQSLADCAAGLPTSTFKRAGMWHNFRALNLRQVMALRSLTDTLPPPSSTRTIVVTGYTAAPLVATGARPTATAAPPATSKP